MSTEASPTARRATRQLLKELSRQREELGEIADELIALLEQARRAPPRKTRAGNDPPE